MRIQIYISVTVLILIQKSDSEAVSLPSPANMSIQCDSYGAEVRWEYPDLHQDVYFQVEVKDDFNERNSNITQNLHLNISSMLSKPAFNRYYVTVTAVRGGEKSELPPPDSAIIQFSYNGRATSNIKCYLDFPEVELSPKDGKLHVQFINPLQLYRNSPALRDLTDHLQYCIETEEGKNEVCETCEMKQNTCETSVVFSEHRDEYCVNLTGNVGQRFFNLRSGCFTGDIRSYPPVTVYLYPVLGVVLTLLFITTVIILLVKKCNSETKKEIYSVFQHFFDLDQTPAEKCKTLKLEEENVETPLQIKPAEDTKEQTNTNTKDQGSGDSEDKSACGPNDIVANEQSDFYDCPHAPGQRQEMSPGDTVDGYGPKLL